MPKNRNPDPQLPPSSLRSWPLLASEVLHAFPIYRLRRDSRQSPRTGKVHTFLVLDATDWVNVVPVTPEGNVVLIRQFRHGTGSFVLEVPGGMVDPADQSPEEAARRELLEETGYAAERFRYLGFVHPNPAIQNNRTYTVLVENCRRTHPVQFDQGEDIVTHLMPVNVLPELVASGRIRHCIVVAALYHFDLWRRGLSRAGHGPLDLAQDHA